MLSLIVLTSVEHRLDVNPSAGSGQAPGYEYEAAYSGFSLQSRLRKIAEDLTRARQGSPGGLKTKTVS